MNNKIFAISFGLLFGFSTNTAIAYELATHGAITSEAHKRSTLKDGELLKQLGVDLLTNPEEPFGSIYYDVSGFDVKTRASNSFEDTIIKRFGVQPLSIAGWLMRGAIREDDTLAWDDPVADVRVRHHFYDPVYHRALTKGTALGEKAPDRALGTQDFLATPAQPNNNRTNHYAVFDAREAMYRALTGKKADGSNEPSAANKAGRDKYWATAFRALGNIVHLVQDMSQPQHTRNDLSNHGVNGARSIT